MRVNAFCDFFKPTQKELRGKSMRKVYALGLQVTTVGPNDGNGLFQAFVIANGGGNMVTPDGQLHTSDPKVREAVIKSCAYLTEAYKQGYIPPEALSWNDADDNCGFHEKLFVVDFDGTLSTELAMIKDTQTYMHDVVTMGLPNGNDGQPMAAQFGAGGGASGADLFALRSDSPHEGRMSVTQQALPAGPRLATSAIQATHSARRTL